MRGASANASWPSRRKPKSSCALATESSAAANSLGARCSSSPRITSVRNTRLPQFHR